MTIFEYEDYRLYLRDFLAHKPKRGRGELSKIAAHLGVNSTLLSQILGGTRDFTPEQIFELSPYLGHSNLESEYFSCLVQISRSSHAGYQKALKEKLLGLKDESLKIAKRVQLKKTLEPKERSVFYSAWIYSAVHAFCSMKDEGVLLEEVTSRFYLPREKALEILRFLSEAGLVEEVDFRYRVTTQSTFIERGTPDWRSNHTNWRLKSIEQCESIKNDEMMFTAQVSISRRDFKVLRETMLQMIQEIVKTIETTEPEELAVLNLDWFYLK